MEREREKVLVLTGKIPFDKAPKEMINHPVLLIEKYCEQQIAERRAKVSKYTLNIYFTVLKLKSRKIDIFLRTEIQSVVYEKRISQISDL